MFGDTRGVTRRGSQKPSIKDKTINWLNEKGQIRVITKLPNSEQSYKGKVKTHKYTNRQNQSTTENCENRNDPHLVQTFLKKW